VRAASCMTPSAEAKPQADPAMMPQESKALTAMLRERPRRDFDAECADLF
jgi:hypothetical protein